MTAPGEAVAPPPERTIARLVQVFRSGSTHPTLAETAAGTPVIVKFAGAGQGPRGLVTEFLATRVAAHMGLAVPAVDLVYLPPGFPWQIGTDEFDDLVRRSFGWNLGLGYLRDARNATAVEIGRLSYAFSAQLAMVDRVVQNIDRSLRNPNIMLDAAGAPWAIDFGACLFLERVVAGTPRSYDLARDHFLLGKRLAAPPPMRLPSRAEFAAWLAELPDAWIATLGRERSALADGLAEYVTAFSQK